MAFTIEEQKEFEILKDKDIKNLKEELARLSEEKDKLFNDSIKPATELKNIEFEMEEITKRVEVLKNKEDKTTEELKEESQIANEFRALVEKREEYSNAILEFNSKKSEILNRKNEILEEISNRESQIKEMLNPSKKKISGELLIGKLILDIGNVNITKKNNEIISTNKKSVNSLINIYSNSELKLVVDEELKDKIENTKLITITEEYVSESDSIYKQFLKRIDEQKIVQECIEEIESFETEKQEEERILDDSIKLVGEDKKEEIEVKEDDSKELNISEIVNEKEIVTPEVEEKPQIEVTENVTVETDSNIFGTPTDVKEEEKVVATDTIKYDRNKISVATPDRLRDRVIPNFKDNESNRLDYVVNQRDGKVINVVSKKDYLEAQRLGMNILSPINDIPSPVSSENNAEITSNISNPESNPVQFESVGNIFDTQPASDLSKAM